MLRDDTDAISVVWKGYLSKEESSKNFQILLYTILLPLIASFEHRLNRCIEI